MQDIGYSLILGLGQIFSQMLDARANQPNQKGLQGRLLCRHRLQCRHPSQQPRLFRECQACLEVLQVPKHYDCYADLQSCGFSGNLGLWASMFTYSHRIKRMEYLAFLILLLSEMIRALSGKTFVIFCTNFSLYD